LLGSFSVQGDENVDQQQQDESQLTVVGRSYLKGNDQETVTDDEDLKSNKIIKHKHHTGRCKKRRTVIVFMRRDNVDWNRRDILSNLEHFELPSENMFEIEEEDEEIYDQIFLEKPVLINFDISNFLEKGEIEKKQKQLIKAKIKHSLKKKYCGCPCTKSYMYHYLNGTTETFPYENHIRSTLEALYSRKEAQAAESFEADSKRDAVVVLEDDEVEGDEHKDEDLDDIEGLTEAELKLLSQKQRSKLTKKNQKTLYTKVRKSRHCFRVGSYLFLNISQIKNQIV